MPPVLCFIRPHVLSYKNVHQTRLWSPASSSCRLRRPQQCTRSDSGRHQDRIRVYTNEPANSDVELSDVSLLWLILQRAVVAAGFVHVFTEYVADITLCEGPSMLPTLALSGDVIMVEKVSVRWRGLRDGESAFGRTQAARRRQDEYEMGNVWHETLPNNIESTVSCQSAWEQLSGPISMGDVVVANHPRRTGSICKRVVGLPGDQVIERSTGKIQRVPDGHIWLEGDNARQSKDSRAYGPIPVALVKGRVVARVWPVRGSAWMRRLRPSSTVLPAGYRGEHIMKSESELEAMRKK